MLQAFSLPKAYEPSDLQVKIYIHEICRLDSDHESAYLAGP